MVPPFLVTQSWGPSVGYTGPWHQQFPRSWFGMLELGKKNIHVLNFYKRRMEAFGKLPYLNQF